MNLDWNKIEKAWNDFASNHNMILKDIDQHLLINKRQIYYSIEKQDDYEIHYRYVFYKLDTINAGNNFKIVIPIQTDRKVQISRPGLVSRLISKKYVAIKANNKIELDDKIKNLIIDRFREFSDLKINLGFVPNPTISIDESKFVLEIQTRELPTNIDGLETLRELILILFKYFDKRN